MKTNQSAGNTLKQRLSEKSYPQLLAERESIKNHLTNSYKFVWNSPSFEALPVARQLQIVKQLSVMSDYYFILSQYIERLASTQIF